MLRGAVPTEKHPLGVLFVLTAPRVNTFSRVHFGINKKAHKGSFIFPQLRG